MKGTVYLWVLAAVLSGALVGLLGFAIEGFFSLRSSFMEPASLAPLPGSWRYSLRSRSFETGKQISRSAFCLELRRAFQPPLRWQRTRYPQPAHHKNPIPVGRRLPSKMRFPPRVSQHPPRNSYPFSKLRNRLKKQSLKRPAQPRKPVASEDKELTRWRPVGRTAR
jgi:hypothetical protein